MIAKAFGMLAASAALVASASAAEYKQPIKIPGASLPTAVFSTPGTKDFKGPNGEPVRDLNILRSTDKKAYSGVYDSPVKERVPTGPEGYEVDEFMYFFKGGVKLTSEDGTVTEAGPGDVVTIHKGWKGVWESDGYSKFYVIYDASKAAE